MSVRDLPSTPVIELKEQLASGSLSSVELVGACCARIEARDNIIHAWAWFDRQAALKQAEELDLKRQSGAPLGPLHGMPVAIKDIIDTAGISTENGCTLDQGRVPVKDAEVVTRLKESGAVIMGKTVTTELAFLSPSQTHNPHNVEHTPGGSSSGSAAAVADGMVPLALGSQTGGSIVRPASFCGVVGLKPQFGAIPTDGVLMQSPSLDTLGVFARDPAGAGYLASVLMADRLPKFADGYSKAATGHDMPVFGFVRLPGWKDAEASVHQAFEILRSALGPQMKSLKLPNIFDTAQEQRAIINAAEMAYHFDRYYRADPALLKNETRTGIEDGLQVSAQTYLAAKDYQAKLAIEADCLFDGCDVLICPAALGPAPETLTSTGDSIFNGLWTLTGSPAITLPLLSAPDGLPIGVQLVARSDEHSTLLRAADWLWTVWQER